MPYDSVVLVKQVPDTSNITGHVMKADGTVNRAALPAIFNPEDLNALEMALELRERFGGTVTVITMGPPAACELLREALYMGADDVVLLTDRRFAEFAPPMRAGLGRLIDCVRRAAAAGGTGPLRTSCVL